MRIETEPERTNTGVPEAFVSEDPDFGIWRDREDIADVEACVQKLRAPRYASD